MEGLAATYGKTSNNTSHYYAGTVNKVNKTKKKSCKKRKKST